jgi:hypothetical protein
MIPGVDRYIPYNKYTFFYLTRQDPDVLTQPVGILERFLTPCHAEIADHSPEPIETTPEEHVWA